MSKTYKYNSITEVLSLNGKALKGTYKPSMSDMDILMSLVCSRIKIGETITSILKGYSIDIGLFLEAIENSDDYSLMVSRAEKIKSRVLEDELVELSKSLMEDGVGSSDISGIKARIDTIKYIMSISGNAKYSKEGSAGSGDMVFNFISYDIEERGEVIDWFNKNWNDSKSKFKVQVLSTSLERLKKDFDESS